MKKVDFIFSVLFFNISSLIYPKINHYVNYMWDLNLNFSWKLLIFYNILIFIILPFINKKKITIQYFQMILLFGIVMPIFSISINTTNYVFESILVFISYAITIGSIHFFLRVRIPVKKQLNAVSIKNLIYSILLLSTLIIFVQNGFNFSLDIATTLKEVYIIRAKQNVTGLTGYMTGWLAFLLTTITLSDYFENGKIRYLLFAALTAIVLFQTFALKSNLLSLFLLFFFGLTAKKHRIIPLNPVILFYLMVFLFSSLSLNLSSPLLDRFYYLPGMLNAHYLEFFMEHRLNYFNLSKLSIFFNVENYKVPVGYVIDNYYYNGGGMNANTGSYASIFSEIGTLGILIILPTIIGITISALSRLESRFYYFSLLLIVNLGFLMINSPFNDVFFTHGLIFPLILTPFIRINR